MSKPMQAFLKSAFCRARPTDNKTRRTWVECFSVLEGDETRCPKLESILKNELPNDAVELDRKFCLQNFVLDIVGPLMILEKPDLDVVLSAIQQALMFLGNASAHFNMERRSKALSWLNLDLKSRVEDEDFSQAAPYLFGPGFKRKAKERSEAVKCLRKASSTRCSKPFFSRLPFLPGRKWEWFSRPPLFLYREEVSNSLLGVKSHQNVSEQSFSPSSTMSKKD